jgi:hypothetical protein
VVDLSQVKRNATTHGGNIIRFQKETNQAALAENLELTSLPASRKTPLAEKNPTLDALLTTL